MSPNRGAAIADALVALVVAGMGLTVLAGRSSGVALRTTTETASLLDLAAARLEALRLWPTADGADTGLDPHGLAYHRTWVTTGGRGLPRQLSVAVTTVGGHRRVSLSGEAFP
jgi:hypothetical protein